MLKKIKRQVAIVLTIACLGCLVGCGQTNSSNGKNSSINEKMIINKTQSWDEELEDAKKEYSSLSDDALLQQIKDDVYAQLESSFDSENYRIENVNAVYVSKEYLDELAYNSQANIYFGYTLKDIEAVFGEKKYVFTCDENGKTVLKEYEKYDDTFDQIVKNVAIGAGVILVCVSVSVVSAGVGASTVSTIFAVSAKSGATAALSSGVLGGAMSALITGAQTGDIDLAMKNATLEASEGFKWGAIAGATIGGVSESINIWKKVKAASSIPSPQESELYVKSIKGGEGQVSYLNGEIVDRYTKGSTCPDVVLKKADGTIDAIEVKNYDLSKSANRNSLYSSLKKEVSSRNVNLPVGSTQRIVLDTRGRNYPSSLVKNVKIAIQKHLADIYPNIPVEVV